MRHNSPPFTYTGSTSAENVSPAPKSMYLYLYYSLGSPKNSYIYVYLGLELSHNYACIYEFRHEFMKFLLRFTSCPLQKFGDLSIIDQNHDFRLIKLTLLAISPGTK